MFVLGPAPQVNRGTIVLLKSGEYVLVKESRWVRLPGEIGSQWLYDGTVLDVSKAGTLRILSVMPGIQQTHIAQIIAT